MELPAQRKVRVFSTCCLLFFVSLSLTAYSARNPSVGRLGAAVLSQLLYPFQNANRHMVSSVAEFWRAYITLVDAKEENRTLKEAVEELQGDSAELKELQDENVRLRELLEMSRAKSLQGVAANVIGYDPSNWVQAVTVDKGSVNGVRPGMAVLHARGVVGQVTGVSSNTARVLLITDHSSGVDSLIQRTRARGVVGGRGLSGCELKYVEKERDVREADLVVSSGLDDVYPKGMIVGKVSTVDSRADALFHEILLEPVVDFSRLESVFIVRPVEME